MLNIKMKINKINFDKSSGIIVVWTSAFPLIGFHFKIGEIVDKAYLKLKLKVRIQEEQDKKVVETSYENKFNLLKELEGKDI